MLRTILESRGRAYSSLYRCTSVKSELTTARIVDLESGASCERATNYVLSLVARTMSSLQSISLVGSTQVLGHGLDLSGNNKPNYCLESAALASLDVTFCPNIAYEDTLAVHETMRDGDSMAIWRQPTWLDGKSSISDGRQTVRYPDGSYVCVYPQDGPEPELTTMDYTSHLRIINKRNPRHLFREYNHPNIPVNDGWRAWSRFMMSPHENVLFIEKDQSVLEVSRLQGISPPDRSWPPANHALIPLDEEHYFDEDGTPLHGENHGGAPHHICMIRSKYHPLPPLVTPEDVLEVHRDVYHENTNYVFEPTVGQIPAKATLLFIGRRR